MILSGKEIIKANGNGLLIKPFIENQLNPNSYNLRLHNEILIYKDEILDIEKKNDVERLIIPDDGFLLEPKKLYLARTIEYTESLKYIPFIEGRSSLGRLGLSIHKSSPYGNIGFKGHWTLELSCVQPIIIYPGIEICQIYFQGIQGDFNPYSSDKYQNNTDIQPSYFYKELK